MTTTYYCVMDWEPSHEGAAYPHGKWLYTGCSYVTRAEAEERLARFAAERPNGRFKIQLHEGD